MFDYIGKILDNRGQVGTIYLDMKVFDRISHHKFVIIVFGNKQKVVSSLYRLYFSRNHAHKIAEIQAEKTLNFDNHSKNNI